MVATAADAVVSCDMLVAGTHFDDAADPYLLGRKALAVNLSDMAAMGARPRHCLLALSLPGRLAATSWIRLFARGLLSQASEHEVALVGGDLAHGERISIAVTIIGEVAEGTPLLRSAASVGDELWLSGSVGGAGDELRRGRKPGPRSRLHNPTPRVALGQQLVGVASAAIDLSDGLALAALQLARASGRRLLVNGRAIPLASCYARDRQALEAAVCAGEDYELLFAASRAQRARIEALGRRLRLRLTRIGRVAKGSGGVISYGNKKMRLQLLATKSYQHFKEDQAVPGQDPQALATEIARLALKVGARLAVAESCTGGLLGAALTEVPGSSRWFQGGVVCYANSLKEELLGVERRLIRDHGAVSSQVARRMAVGARTLRQASLGVAITGVAGPRGSRDKPAGLVYVAWAGEGPVVVRKYKFAGGRSDVRRKAVAAALAGIKALLA